MMLWILFMQEVSYLAISLAACALMNRRDDWRVWLVIVPTDILALTTFLFLPSDTFVLSSVCSVCVLSSMVLKFCSLKHPA